MSRSLAALAGCWLLGLAPQAGDVAQPRYQLYYELEASLRSVGLEAEVRAGAKFEMAAEAGERGGLRLSLVRFMTPAWKYYRVDPVGPFGAEAKLGAVATLSSPSWAAVEEARVEMERFGAEQHQLVGPTKQPFDGAFTFFIIGPEWGRFVVELAPGGGLVAVSDQLSDRWLPGELDPLLKAWQTTTPGFWFWNRGESQPPSWQPRTVEALARALAILALPTASSSEKNTGKRPSDGASQPGGIELDGVSETLADVLALLVPKARGRFEEPHHLTADSRETELAPGLLERRVISRQSPASSSSHLRFERRLRFDLHSLRPRSDEIDVEWVRSEGRLRLRVGVQAFE